VIHRQHGVATKNNNNNEGNNMEIVQLETFKFVDHKGQKIIVRAEARLINSKNKIDCIEFVADNSKTGEIVAWDRYYLPKPISYKGTKIKEFFKSAAAVRYFNRVATEVIVHEHAKKIKRYQAPKGYSYTSSFHTSALAGFYKTADNCKYAVGYLNSVNLICQLDGSVRLELTDGYKSYNGGFFGTINEAIERADELLKTGNDYLKPVVA
jgi:hypothetical protein